MKLFRMDGYDLRISDEALCLKPFRTLWKRDKSKGKETAMMELTYVFMMEDPRSDYQTFIDKEERDRQVRTGLGLKDSWKPDKAITEAMEFYASFKSEAALLLEDIRVAITKLREYIKTIDLNAVDDKGKPIYTLNTYTATIGQIPKLITSLDEAEKAIARDIMQNDRIRGGMEKGIYEDG